MHKIQKISLNTLLILLLSACSTSQETVMKKIDFSTPGYANPEDTFQVPPDLTGISSKNKYDLPKTGVIRASDMQNAKKRGNGEVLPKYNNLHLKKEGSDTYLVIEGIDAQSIWDNLMGFWQEMGFVIDKSEPAIGTMETKWAENRASIPQDFIRNFLEKMGLGAVYSSAFKDKFVSRIEKDGDKINLIITHQGREEVFTGRNKESTVWQPRERDTQLEVQMLGRFMMRLGANQEQIVDEIEQVGSVKLAQMRNDQLVLKGAFERNNYRLKRALERIGFNILGFDPKTNVFLVSQADEDTKLKKKKNILASLLHIKDKSEKKEEKAGPKPKYFVYLTQKGNESFVSITNSDKSKFDREKEVLDLLYKELN